MVRLSAVLKLVCQVLLFTTCSHLGSKSVKSLSSEGGKNKLAVVLGAFTVQMTNILALF